MQNAKIMSGGRHEQRTADKHPLSHSADPTAEYSGSVACAVVVTFNPDGGFPERLNELSTRFQRVLVVDNSDRDLRLDALSADRGNGSLQHRAIPPQFGVRIYSEMTAP